MRYNSVETIKSNKHVFTIQINKRLLNKRIKLLNKVITEVIMVLAIGFIIGSFLNFIYR